MLDARKDGAACGAWNMDGPCCSREPAGCAMCINGSGWYSSIIN